MTASTFSFVITGATTGVYYNVAVQAVNVVGPSALSSSATIVAAVAPSPPSTIQILAQSSSSITISWFAVTGSAMGGTPISSYLVSYKESTDAVYTTAGSTTSTTLQFTQSVSSPGATYNFIVYAANAAGTSVASTVLSVIAANSPSTMSAPFLIYADTTQI